MEVRGVNVVGNDSSARWRLTASSTAVGC